MGDLIEALTIFRKYKDEQFPTGCEHDVLYVYGITKDEVSAEDQARLESLGFRWDTHDDNWQSFRFGSA